MVLTQRPIIVGVVETWLNTSLNSSILGIPTYNVLRRDRKEKGGGLIVAVMDSIPQSIIFTSSTFEILSVEIILRDLKIRIIIGYVPNIIDYQTVFGFFDEVSKLIPKTPFLIMGDFNLPAIDWSSLSFPQNAIYSMY